MTRHAPGVHPAFMVAPVPASTVVQPPRVRWSTPPLVRDRERLVIIGVGVLAATIAVCLIVAIGVAT